MRFQPFVHFHTNLNSPLPPSLKRFSFLLEITDHFSISIFSAPSGSPQSSRAAMGFFMLAGWFSIACRFVVLLVFFSSLSLFVSTVLLHRSPARELAAFALIFAVNDYGVPRFRGWKSIRPQLFAICFIWFRSKTWLMIVDTGNWIRQPKVTGFWGCTLLPRGRFEVRVFLWCSEWCWAVGV